MHPYLAFVPVINFAVSTRWTDSFNFLLLPFICPMLASALEAIVCLAWLRCSAARSSGSGCLLIRDGCFGWGIHSLRRWSWSAVVRVRCRGRQALGPLDYNNSALGFAHVSELIFSTFYYLFTQRDSPRLALPVAGHCPAGPRVHGGHSCRWSLQGV